MKRIINTALLSLVFLLVSVGSPLAGTYNFFAPTDSNGEAFEGLNHYYNYTWGLNWHLPAGETVVSASLFFNDIRNWNSSPNVLYLHLLDTATAGVTKSWDNKAGGDNFLNQGLSLFTWNNLSATATDLTYTFTKTDLGTLTAFLADGNIGFGLDPDCHFYNNGVTFTVETETVPIPGAIWLLASGLLGFLSIRRKHN